MKHEQEMWKKQAMLKLKDELYTDNVLKGMILEKTSAIYNYGDRVDVRVLNLEGSGDAQGMGQIFAGYRALTENLNN